MRYNRVILILALLPLYVAAFLACSALFGEQSIFKSANDLLEAPAILVRPGLEGASATQWASVVVATGLLSGLLLLIHRDPPDQPWSPGPIEDDGQLDRLRQSAAFGAISCLLGLFALCAVWDLTTEFSTLGLFLAAAAVFLTYRLLSIDIANFEIGSRWRKNLLLGFIVLLLLGPISTLLGPLSLGIGVFLMMITPIASVVMYGAMEIILLRRRVRLARSTSAPAPTPK